MPEEQKTEELNRRGRRERRGGGVLEGGNSRGLHSGFIRASCGARRVAGMTNENSWFAAGRAWLQRRALFFKVIGVSFFGLLLMIPLGMVHSTLHERQMRSEEAVRSVTETWGRAQRLLGPVLVVPYTYQVGTGEWNALGQQHIREVTAEAFFLPESLAVAGALEPSARKRGIYTAHVFTGALKVSGKFARPDFGFVGVANPQPQWAKARVSFAISDLRGTREALTLAWNGVEAPLHPGARLDNFTTGLHALVEHGGQAAEFALALTLNGSDSLTVVPLGRDTRLQLNSTWADPSFMGAQLPVTREVGPEGFSAAWKVSYYGRDFPQQWTSLAGTGQPEVKEFETAAFGVRLMPALGAYRTVERAIKYGVLFVALVFTTFFLFEAVCVLRLNALNYLLVGAALCLFFLGLLALSEVVSFGAAYGFAAGASTLLIGLYSARILRSGRRAWVVSGMLGGVYGYLFFVLQLEDFSLLAGTAALFAMLAAVMYATRNLRSELPEGAVAEGV